MRFLRVGATVLMAVTACVGFAGRAGAVTEPVVRVSPHSQLVGGEMITVRWAGFERHGQVGIEIAECTANFDTIGFSACTQLHSFAASARRGVDHLPVTAGPIGEGSCGTNRHDRDCVIVVWAIPHRGPINSQGQAPIRFAVPA